MTRTILSAPPVPRARPGGDFLVIAVSRWMMPGAAVLLLIAFALARVIARDWPLVHDSVLIHYVVFLMDHGKAPYRDIVEMNMPGTYMTQWVAIHLFGGDASGWRAWDFALELVAIGASAWIAGTGRRWTGIAAGSLASIDHLADGAEHLGQRDWLVAVLLLLAFGCLFKALRERRPAWMAGFMGCSGLATSIKPPVLMFAVGFVIAAGWLARRRQVAGGIKTRGGYEDYVLWSLIGGLVPGLLVLLFLLRWGVTSQFVNTVDGLVPWYASLQRLRYVAILPKAIVLRPLVLGSLIVFLLGRSWRRWEPCFLGAAVLAGVVLFTSQGKGFPYHLYPEVVFAALWGMLELNRGIHRVKIERLVAIVTMLVTVFVTAPRLLSFERDNHYPLETITKLEEDLSALGGSRLSDKVQCLDMTMGGCIDVLYRMKLMQSTGFIYDFYLLPKQTNSIVESLRGRFLQEMTSRPPEVIVLSSQTWPGRVRGYQQLDHWPAFEEFLQERYRMYKELPEQPRSAGYRIYALRQGAAQ